MVRCFVLALSVIAHQAAVCQAGPSFIKGRVKPRASALGI
jgi:hypothetical protein